MRDEGNKRFLRIQVVERICLKENASMIEIFRTDYKVYIDNRAKAKISGTYFGIV